VSAVSEPEKKAESTNRMAIVPKVTNMVVSMSRLP
jgi:hypothetical protein